MSSHFTSRQAATAQWAQHPGPNYNHNTDQQSLGQQQNSNAHHANSFRTSSAFYQQSDPQAPASSGIDASQGLTSHQPYSSHHSSNTLQPSNVINDVGTPFSFDDYLTPEFSSDLPCSEQSVQTTPAVPELKWQEVEPTFYGSQEVDPILFNNTGDGDFDTSNMMNEMQYDYLSKAVGGPSVQGEMYASHASTAVGQAGQADVQQPQPSSNLLAPSLQRSSSKSKRSHDQSDADLTSDAYSRHARSVTPQLDTLMAQVVSPAVLVSTYSRGDSPARVQVPMARSLSKRSQGSRLTEEILDIKQQSPVTSPTHLMPPKDTEEEEDEWEPGDEERSGLAPGSRNNDFIPSLKDMEHQQELEASRAEVENWLATSEAGTPPDEARDRVSRRDRTKVNKPRSRSTGALHDPQRVQAFEHSNMLGPGLLLDETSEGYYTSEEEPVADLETINRDEREGSYFPPMPNEEEDEEDDVAPEDIEPLPRQFYRKTPWQDPVRGPTSKDHDQPPTSNAAMMAYEQRIAKFETASRAATWGTRRLSDSEIQSILDGSQVSRHLLLKDTFANKARARGTSFFNSVKNSIPGRSNSFIKKRQQPSSRQHSPEDKAERLPSPSNEQHRNSTSSISRLHRMSSSSKVKPAKSPPLDTGSAFMAMTSQLTAVGSRGANPDPEQGNALFNSLKRNRSRSELPKSPKQSFGLSQLFTHNNNVPPAPVLGSPLQVTSLHPFHTTSPEQEPEGEVDDDEDEETGVKMDMPMHPLNITPDLNGFKTQIRQLNPRLEPFLVDRIATDQLRRFKKLVKNRAEHMQAVQANGCCSSGPHCHDFGGRSTPLPPRANTKDSNVNLAQFKITTGLDSDAEEGAFVDGVVTPALFPPGIPLPPTKTLPAEFECFLCFQVKKFQKPSDWTKHVHEDVQPFTCTFPNCTEPKSFKRKADWVRHENERHRHLEWWRCNIQECNHVCYRKDNFVQHLVREHKMREPKGKGAKSGGTRTRTTPRPAQSIGPSNEDFWHIVDTCRAENPKKSKSEPCKFCGNHCNTWKKLSVHVGKHMEQIAMPVLGLAKQQETTADTVVSPIEPAAAQNYNSGLLDASMAGHSEQFARSPYTASSHSAGHSPAMRQVEPPTMNPRLHANTYSPNNGLQPVQNQFSYNGYTNNAVDHTYMSAQPPAPVYAPVNINQGYNMAYPTEQPRSIALEPQYSAPEGGMMQVPYNTQQYYNGNGIAETYGPGYGTAMSHDSGMMARMDSAHSSHGHTPVTSGPGEDTTFYTTQQGAQSGQRFY